MGGLILKDPKNQQSMKIFVDKYPNFYNAF